MICALCAYIHTQYMFCGEEICVTKIVTKFICARDSKNINDPCCIETIVSQQGRHI